MKKYFKLAALLVFAIGVSACQSEKVENENPPGFPKNFEDKSSEVELDPEIAKDFRPQKVTNPPIPEVVTFAGDTIPLHREDVREALEYELIVNTFRHSRTMTVLKNIDRWRPLIEQTLHDNQVPIDFIYLAVAESEFDNTAMSHMGAMGMWQFMESTAKDYDLEVNRDVDMRRDPKLATEAASRYLKFAYSKFNDWLLVAASYNRGIKGIQNNLEDQKTSSFFDLHLNPETERYVYRILAFKLILENPEAYGYYIKPEERYEPYAFITETIDKDIDNLVEYAQKNNISYKHLRTLNPWFNNTNNYKLNVPRKATFEMRLPIK